MEENDIHQSLDLCSEQIDRVRALSRRVEEVRAKNTSGNREKTKIELTVFGPQEICDYEIDGLDEGYSIHEVLAAISLAITRKGGE